MRGDRTSTTQSGGIGFCGLLCVVFITLKLLGIIQWSWLWVLAPAWIPIVIVFMIFAVNATLLYIRLKKGGWKRRG